MSAVAIPITASAGTIPSGINAHNGYIEVTNHIKIKDAPSGKMPDPPIVRVMFHNSIVDDLSLPYGHTAYLNKCCFAAGTHYTVDVLTEARFDRTSLEPKLCNVRGIPFGFAVINLDGTVFWYDKDRRWVVDVRPHVTYVSCPTG